jgi:crotonobetainyl-CoA:carnitine CoA-transferase CaiB-like acyl-CoA transferase
MPDGPARVLPELGDATRRVLEVASGVAGSMAGLYLASFGFQVTRVIAGELGSAPDGFTTPEYRDIGPASRRFLRQHKTDLPLDIGTPEGRARLAALAGEADLIIEQLTPEQRASTGEEYGRAKAARPELVTVAISPFGLNGPMAAWAATEIVVDAAGGWLQHIGKPDCGPVRPPGHQSEVMGALAAVTAGVAGLIQADATGHGDLIDLSLRECVTWFQMNPTTVYSYSGAVGHRTGGASDVNYPQGVFECRDGLVGINVLYYVEWFRFCDLLRRQDWKNDPRLETPLLRYQNRELIDEVLLPWLSSRTADEIYAAGQAHRLPFGRVNAPLDLLGSRQLRGRQFWRHIPDGGHELVLPSIPAVFS